MATALRVLLWTVVLVAPGGFLLVPVLAATSLSQAQARSVGGNRPRTFGEYLAKLRADVREALAALQRRWTKR